MTAAPANSSRESAPDSVRADHPLTVLTTCRVADLPILEITARRLRENIPCRGICVVAPDRDCRQMRQRLGAGVQVIPEDEFIPGMKIEALRAFKAPGFPKAAGWYFQQFLKLQYAFVEPQDDFYLIWDADTVPLKPMRFFDSDGRMLLTKAEEHHESYFETYRKLFGSEPGREFSFIAQHMLVQKSIAREMLARIEQRIAGTDPWPWKIMKSLPETGDNLFSEYETYGHYVKNLHPDRVKFITRPWDRQRAPETGRSIPSEKELVQLAQRFEYVAFERYSQGWRRLAKFVVGSLRRLRGAR